MTETTPPLPKQDPETLVLRAAPTPVVRFKRPVLIGTAAIGCVVIFGITWMGLRTPVPRVAETKELYNADAAADRPTFKPEQLDALPVTYAELPPGTPALGAPLPGDLGGPVLAQQQAMPVAAERHYPPASPPTSGERASSVFFQTRATTSEREGVEGPPAAKLFDVALTNRASPAPLDVTATQPVGSRQTGRIYNSHMLETPASPYQVMAGTVIAASLVTGLKSDLSGLVIAQVTAPVFDTVTGKVLLIPQGTKLLGEYQNDLSFGQSRVLLVWKRLILPDGSSLEIDNFPAADSRGYAGLTDQVDNHTWSLLKGVGLSTLLGLTTYDSQESDSDLVTAFREATRQTANRAGQEMVRRAIEIKPTITVRPGWPVRVIVQKDLILRPYGGAETPWPN